MRTAMTEGFITALAALDGADAKRVAAFLERLVAAGDEVRREAEIVHEAGDRAVRSLRVTHDLRAIVCFEEDHIVLLHVGHHDQAYAWARDHCIRCRPLDGAIEVVDIETAPRRPETIERVVCVVDDSGTLCEALDARGIAHDVTP